MSQDGISPRRQLCLFAAAFLAVWFMRTAQEGLTLHCLGDDAWRHPELDEKRNGAMLYLYTYRVRADALYLHPALTPELVRLAKETESIRVKLAVLDHLQHGRRGVRWHGPREAAIREILSRQDYETLDAIARRRTYVWTYADSFHAYVADRGCKTESFGKKLFYLKILLALHHWPRRGAAVPKAESKAAIERILATITDPAEKQRAQQELWDLGDFCREPTDE